MPIAARILLDSLSPAGTRLVTFEATYPRFIHSEVMTHRVLSRNAASSRAIPIHKVLQQVCAQPAMPVWWGKNQAGMQAHEELVASDREEAITWWRRSAMVAVKMAEEGHALGLHKQIVNRVLEPFMHMTTILSATEWRNFFFLRDDEDAQPEFRALARAMRAALEASRPVEAREGEWHLPLVSDVDREEARAYDDAEGRLRAISVGRCARVSYLTHDGRRSHEDDVKLHDRLLAGRAQNRPMHMSPFEHVARALAEPRRSGNFIGFEQYRKLIPGESGPG